MTIKQLVEKRNALAAEMTTLHETTKTEDRSFTGDEKTKWDGMKTDLRGLDERIELAKDAENLSPLDLPQEERTRLPGQQPQGVASELTDDERYSQAFRGYLAGGMSGVNPEQRQLLQDRFVETRAQSVGTNSEGGFTAHDELTTNIIEAMKQFSGLEQLATVLTTGNGSAMLFPTNDDTGNVGEIVAENGAVSEQDTVMGQRSIAAYMYSSKMIRVSLQLLRTIK